MTVNPSILEWARETAGLSPQSAAKVLGFNDTQKRTATERLEALEGGQDEPSRSILLRMAKAYRRPLVVFYLKQPPPQGDRGQDFRATPGSEAPKNPNLDSLIRDVHGRQAIIKGLLEEEEAEPLDFVGSASIGTPSAELASRITERLNFSLQAFRRQSSPEAAFAYLRDVLEQSGVFVILLGNLGSHHTNIGVDVFRGFAISDSVAPLIIINDQDAKTAWSFTALHEAVHLWLGKTGVSSTSIETRIEKYCNDIASAILLPDIEIQDLAYLRGADLKTRAREISSFARERNVSQAMVAYKLFRSRLFSAGDWRQISDHFKQAWAESRAAATEQEGKKSAPSYYVVKRHRLGPAVLKLARRSLAEGVLSYTKAAHLLGVPPRNVAPLLYGSPLQRGGSN